MRGQSRTELGNDQRFQSVKPAQVGGGWGGGGIREGG